MGSGVWVVAGIALAFLLLSRRGEAAMRKPRSDWVPPADYVEPTIDMGLHPWRGNLGAL